MRARSSLSLLSLCSLVALVSLTACPQPLPPPVEDAGVAGEGEGEEGEGEEGEGEEGEGEEGEGEEGEGEGEAVDPFAPQADTSEGLVNTSADLEALLENGALDGACDAWRADRGNTRKKLLCGKQMFFYEGFETLGVPEPIFDFMGNKFPAITGTAWSGYGLVPDPFTPQRPLGAAPGAALGSVPTVAFTCATCHFGQLPDGRYSVGAPNHNYDYGKQILAIAIAPLRVAPGFNVDDHDPDAVAAVQPLLDALDASFSLRLDLLTDLAPLAGADQPQMATSTEHAYASWLTGTQDFMLTPLPLDDGVNTVSKILSLWGLPSPAEAAAAGMPHEQLAWTGGANSLTGFLDAFVRIGGGDEAAWPPAELEPLAAYILSLRAPQNPNPPPAADVARGRALFATQCLACHDGPRGMGRQLYTYDEIGTDRAMEAWGDPEIDGTFCCGFEGAPTHKVKSPRLVGLWAQRRFLHNGSVSSLDELLCLEPRVVDDRDAQGSEGHTYGCDLDLTDRVDLIAFLQTL